MKYYQTITSWWVDRPRLWAMLIGVCIGIPFVFPPLIPIAYIGYFLFWRLIYIAPLSTLPSLLFIVFGLKALLALSWFWSTVPITWLPELTLTVQSVAVFLYWITSAIWLASAGIILALFTVLLRRWPSDLFVYGLPLAVVVSEYLGSIVFSVMTIGPGGSIGGSFSFGHTGYLFPWLYPFALWGGVYAVGVFGLLAISVFHYSYHTKHWHSTIVTTMLLAGLFGYILHVLPTTTQLPTIALVQTDSLPRERIANLEPLVITALNTDADYVLLPEDSRYFTEGQQVELVGLVAAVESWRSAHPTTTALVIDSGRTKLAPWEVTVQRAFLWSTTTIYNADKSYLVPQGEYMPSLYAIALRVLGLGGVADTLQATINYVPGTAVIPPDAPRTVPNILFCFESVSPLAAKRLQAKRPSDFVVHPMSHSWFHSPTILWSQLETMLRFQSVYAQVPIVSVGNDVRGLVYLPNGQVIHPETVATFTEGTVDIIRPFP